LLIIQRVEAELCLFKPKILLYPTYLRLRSRFYRFDDQERRTDWQADLKRLIPDGKTINLEDELRQRLRQLTYELNEESEAYTRRQREKAHVVRYMTFIGFGIILVLLVIASFEIGTLPTGDQSSSTWLPMGLVAGAMGAMVSATSSIGDDTEARRVPLMLIARMLLRMLLGAVYALVVLAAVMSHLVPFTIPTDAPLAFFVVVAVAAGFSDKVFGETVSKLIGSSRTRSERS
jgi:hypothetical protein